MIMLKEPHEILKRNAECFGYDIQKDDNFLPKIFKRKQFFHFFDKSKNKILLHLDEKWHTEEYSIAYKKAKKLTTIRLSSKDILNFAEITYAKETTK